MAEETEFAMGARASCVDGPGGKVIRVIIDPATKTVTHLVIEPKHRVGAGRLVPSTWSTARPTASGCAAPWRSSAGSRRPRRWSWWMTLWAACTGRWVVHLRCRPLSRTLFR